VQDLYGGLRGIVWVPLPIGTAHDDVHECPAPRPAMLVRRMNVPGRTEGNRRGAKAAPLSTVRLSNGAQLNKSLEPFCGDGNSK